MEPALSIPPKAPQPQILWKRTPYPQMVQESFHLPRWIGLDFLVEEIIGGGAEAGPVEYNLSPSVNV